MANRLRWVLAGSAFLLLGALPGLAPPAGATVFRFGLTPPLRVERGLDGTGPPRVRRLLASHLTEPGWRSSDPDHDGDTGGGGEPSGAPSPAGRRPGARTNTVPAWQLVAAGTGASAAGFFVGGYLGATSCPPCPSSDCLMCEILGWYVGSTVAMTVLVPIAVDATNRGRGELGTFSRPIVHRRRGGVSQRSCARRVRRARADPPGAGDGSGPDRQCGVDRRETEEWSRD